MYSTADIRQKLLIQTKSLSILCIICGLNPIYKQTVSQTKPTGPGFQNPDPPRSTFWNSKSFASPHSIPYTTTLWRRVYGCLMLSVLCYQIFYVMRKLFKMAFKIDFIVQLATDMIQSFSYSCTSILCVVINLFNGEEKTDILGRLADIDQDLARLGVSVSYARSKVDRFLIQIGVVWTLLFISDMKTFDLNFKRKIQIALLTLNFTTAITVLELVTFIVHLRFLQVRFSAVNSKFQRLLDQNVNAVRYPQEFGKMGDRYVGEVYCLLSGCSTTPGFTRVDKHSNASTLTSLIEVHSKLRSLSHVVNDRFSLQLLFIVGIIFIDITCKLYYFIYLVMRIHLWCVSERLWLLVYCLSWPVLCILCLCVLLSGTEAIHRLVRKTVSIIHDMIIVSDMFREQLEHFSLQLLHDNMVFTAYNFFNLDYSLFYTIIGGTTTYLVILLQFQLNTKAPCTDMTE